MARWSQKFTSYSLPPVIRPPHSSVFAGYGGGGETVTRTYSTVTAHGNPPRAITLCTGLWRIKIQVRPIEERHGGKKRDTCVFWFILCNDNDIIDMNNAMSATTLLLFSPPSDFHAATEAWCTVLWFTLLQEHYNLRCSALFPSTFEDISPFHSPPHGLNTDSMAVPLPPCILRCDCIDVGFLFFLPLLPPFHTDNDPVV